MFSNVKTKTNSSFAVKATERSNHSFLLSSWWITGISTIMELKELNCVNIWKTSEAANLVFQWIFVLNSVKHKFFHVSIVKQSTNCPIGRLNYRFHWAMIMHEIFCKTFCDRHVFKTSYSDFCFFSLLTLSWRRPLLQRNQSIDLLCKSMETFLYNGLRHERVET